LLKNRCLPSSETKHVYINGYIQSPGRLIENVHPYKVQRIVNLPLKTKIKARVIMLLYCIHVLNLLTFMMHMDTACLHAKCWTTTAVSKNPTTCHCRL